MDAVAARTLHDQLLAIQPEGASHDASTCPVCQPGGQSVKTYSEEEAAALVASAVASATKDLTTRLADLEAAQASSQVEAKVAAARAEGETKAAELQAAVDAKEIELQAEKQARAALEAKAAAEAEKAVCEARKADRLTRAKEAAGFGDDHISAERADELAAMPDAEFDALVVAWSEARTAALASREGDPPKPPPTTGLTTARETATDTAKKSKASEATAVLAGYGASGVDIRRVHG